MDQKIRNITWQKNHPTKHLREMRNPEKWLGRFLPVDLDADSIPNGYTWCDECNKLIHSNEFHSVVSIECAEDWNILDALHIDLAEGFCQFCTDIFTDKAVKINPNFKYGSCSLA